MTALARSFAQNTGLGPRAPDEKQLVVSQFVRNAVRQPTDGSCAGWKPALRPKLGHYQAIRTLALENGQEYLLRREKVEHGRILWLDS